MDNAIKAAMCFLVFCLGVAAVIFAVAYTSKSQQPQPYPYQTYSVCPRCQQQFVEPPRVPNRPFEIMPTPNSPYRPGSLTGDKGEKK